MNRKAVLPWVYYALALLGFLATWFYNGQYFLQGGGLGPGEFFGAAFANALTTAITIDVYLAALVFSVWVLSERGRLAVKWPWLYIALCFGVGLAIAFPLYLAGREKSAPTWISQRVELGWADKQRATKSRSGCGLQAENGWEGAWNGLVGWGLLQSPTEAVAPAPWVKLW